MLNGQCVSKTCDNANLTILNCREYLSGCVSKLNGGCQNLTTCDQIVKQEDCLHDKNNQLCLWFNEKSLSINNVVRFKNNRIKIAVPFYKIAQIIQMEFAWIINVQILKIKINVMLIIINKNVHGNQYVINQCNYFPIFEDMLQCSQKLEHS